jgi:hypothetical protein
MKEECLATKGVVEHELRVLRQPVRSSLSTLLDVLSFPGSFGLDVLLLSSALPALLKDAREYYKSERLSTRLLPDSNIFLGQETTYDQGMRHGYFALEKGWLSPSVRTLDFLRTFFTLYHKDNEALLFYHDDERLHILQSGVQIYGIKEKEIFPITKRINALAQAYEIQRINKTLMPFALNIRAQSPLDDLLLREICEPASVESWNSMDLAEYGLYEKVIGRMKHLPMLEEDIRKYPRIPQGFDSAHTQGDFHRLIAAYGTLEFHKRFILPGFHTGFVKYLRYLENLRVSLSP